MNNQLTFEFQFCKAVDAKPSSTAAPLTRRGRYLYRRLRVDPALADQLAELAFGFEGDGDAHA